MFGGVTGCAVDSDQIS